MSENYPFINNGHIHEPVDDVTASLPADLEAIHARLMDEGHGWALRLPAAEPLATYARGLAGVPAPVMHDMSEPGDAPTRTEALLGVDVMPQTGATQRGRRPSQARVLFGVAAAVVIVALMAVVFSNLTPGRGSATTKPTIALQPTGTPIPRATPRPTFGPITGNWQAVPGLTNVPGSTAAVTLAPSDPSVVYEIMQTQQQNAEPVGQYARLRRSSDDGATWQDLAVPKPANSSVSAWGPIGTLVSPADPNMILVSILAQMSYNVPQSCPTELTMASVSHGVGISSVNRTLAATIPFDGFQRCTAQYASSDGGAHWAKVDISGVHVGGILSLAAQGNRLYGTVYASDQQPFAIYHIVTSTDSGIHWAPVDTSLLSQVKHICGFVAVPTGTTLFANTNSGNCASGQQSDELWRSDDDGASWRDLGPLGGISIIAPLAAAEQGPNDAQPTLYVYWISKDSLYDLRLKVSTDGGYSWQMSPTAGMPDHYAPYGTMPGTLSDGSLVEIFASNPQAGPHNPITLAFYSWHAGDSEWHQVAPSISLAALDNLWNSWDQFLVTPNGGLHGTLWHTQFNNTFPNSTISVTRYSS